MEVAVITVAAEVAVAAAGGGGGGGGGGPGGTVTIIQPGGGIYPQVVAGTFLNFAAKVSKSNTNGSPISWGVQTGDTCTATNGVSSLGTPGGSTALGMIPTSSADKAVIGYTAPTTPPAGGVVTITALQSPSTTGPCLVVTIVATANKLLSWPNGYAFSFNGFSAASGLPFGVIGRFDTDGAGNIKNGFEDVNIAQSDGSSAAYIKVAFTGTYNLEYNNNTGSYSYGTMTLKITSPAPWAGTPPASPPPTTMTFSFTLSADGTFGALMETDGAANYVGSGFYQIQGPATKFSTQYITGSYAMLLGGTAGPKASAVAKGLVGRLDLAFPPATTTNGTIANTSQSDDQSGSPTSTLTGPYTIDDQTYGHGRFNIMGGANPTVSFYIAFPGALFAMRTDNNAPNANPEGILLGILARIPGNPPANFNNTSLQSGLFELQGISSGGHASAALGYYASAQAVGSTTMGSLSGTIDLNDGGAVPGTQPVSFAGPSGPNPVSFTVAGNGRGTLAFPLNGVTYNFVFYMRRTGVAFVLEQPASDGSNRGRAGRFFPQTFMNPGGGTFFGSTSVTTAGSENAVLVLPITIADKAAAFQNGASYTSVLGTSVMSSGIAGTLTVTDQTTNRGTLTMTAGRMAGSGTAAFYLSSDTEVIMLGTDPTNVEPQLITFDE